MPEQASKYDNQGVNRQTYEDPNCGSTSPHDAHFHSPVGGMVLNCPGKASTEYYLTASYELGQEFSFSSLVDTVSKMCQLPGVETVFAEKVPAGDDGVSGVVISTAKLSQDEARDLFEAYPGDEAALARWERAGWKPFADLPDEDEASQKSGYGDVPGGDV